MPYFVTIYIDPMDFSIPHAFLGLTKNKSPDEFDKIDDEIKLQKLKNTDWKDFDKKWYENLETNEFNDGFYGFAPVKSSSNHWGKVFENNQYEPQWNEEKQQYDYKLRSKETFNAFNRLSLEVSQEQYETLLKEIKKEVEKTKTRNPNLQKDDSKMVSLETLKENLYYNSMPNFFSSALIHNCTTWLLNKLSNIGIEVIYTQEWIPDALILDDLKELFPTITSLHSTFLKFQNIDDNLKSVKGAKAFMTWARTMMDNRYACSIDTAILDKKVKAVCQIKDEIFYETFKQIYTKKEKLENIYSTLNKLLEKLIQRLKDTNATYEKLKGDFELIYFDEKDKQIKLLKASNNYEAITIKELDLSQKQNNFSASKFYPFIFIPKDEIISKILYHQYDYGKVSLEYQREMNAFYKQVLTGELSNKYWSKNFHKLSKNLQGNHQSLRAI